MGAEAVTVWLATGMGLAVSVMIEQIMRPRPSLARPWAAWALHAGIWLMAHAALTLLLARPWFAAAGGLALLLILVLVNNAKFRAMREPFLFQDYDYFIDALRHPRLFIPFLGWWRFLAAVAGGAAAIGLGLWGETSPKARWDWDGQWGGVLVETIVGFALLASGKRFRLPVGFSPERDLRALGFLAYLWRHAEAEDEPPTAASPFEFLALPDKTRELPHLVAVQSESFFDPRPLYTGIRREVLAEFDRLRQDAAACGKLCVPAWGANTVRSEFAFLSGISEETLGVHRFNPFRAIAAGWHVSSLASFLKRLGYRTVCIHPYPASFYQRDRVHPRLGFDTFVDIHAFDNAARFGPYVADMAVVEKVEALIRQSSEPVFVFVITMENHGPLHLERVAESDAERLYSVPPPPGCDDLTVYLRHLANADRMIASLRQTLASCARPASLCWFGDHVPIMPKVYEMFGTPSGAVEYVIWKNSQRTVPKQIDLNVHELGLVWLGKTGLIEI